MNKYIKMLLSIVLATSTSFAMAAGSASDCTSLFTGKALVFVASLDGGTGAPKNVAFTNVTGKPSMKASAEGLPATLSYFAGNQVHTLYLQSQQNTCAVSANKLSIAAIYASEDGLINLMLSGTSTQPAKGNIITLDNAVAIRLMQPDYANPSDPRIDYIATQFALEIE